MDMAGVVVAVGEDSDSMYGSVMWVIVQGTYAQYAFDLQSNGESPERQRIALDRTGTVCEDVTTLATLCLVALAKESAALRQVTQLLTSRLFPARSTPVQCQSGAFDWSGGAVFRPSCFPCHYVVTIASASITQYLESEKIAPTALLYLL